MKVLLLHDVYNLGRAGDVKKVAKGYGRNFLLPQGLALLATPSALVSVDRIKEEANAKRVVLNKEMGLVAEKMVGLQLIFPAKASETGKLYGSVTNNMIASEISEKLEIELTKRNIQSQPLKLLGLHKIKVQLTIDLLPEIEVVIYREGEPIENYMVPAEVLFAGAELEVEEVFVDELEDETVEEVVEDGEEVEPTETPEEETVEEVEVEEETENAEENNDAE